MIQYTIIDKNGSESEDPNNTIFTSTSSWTQNGENLIVYKNGSLQLRPDEYFLLSSNTIQFVSPVVDDDKITMMISNLNTSTYSKVDRTFKKIEGKTQTSLEKEVYEESIKSDQIVYAAEIWTGNIPNTASAAVQQGVAREYSSFELTEDVTVQNKKGWFASQSLDINNRITNWIPAKFGRSFTIRLYDTNDNEIPSSSAIGWRWDYSSGYLFIENNHNISTPFKIKGYEYIGSKGVSSGDSTWRPPVPDYSALPTSGNVNGDVRLTLSDNVLWTWDTSTIQWQKVVSGSYKESVSTKNELPVYGNSMGDVRLVMNENSLYSWNGNVWSYVVYPHDHDNRYYTETEINNILQTYSPAAHTHDSRYYIKTEVDDAVRWRPSVATEGDLPPHTENRDGDVILTRDNNMIWRWDSSDPNLGQGEWIPLLTQKLFWLEPVATVVDLPTIDNVVGHVRLVLEDGEAYYWDGVNWITLTAGDHNHNDLYYTKDETDFLIRWKIPAPNYSSLPINEFNEDGDVRLTTDTNSVYRWNSVLNKWIIVTASPRWRESVPLLISLPITDNVNGDTRIVEENLLIYRWSSVDSLWHLVGLGPHDHDDLYYTKDELDNGQLDSRYYTETEVDAILNQKFDPITGHDHDGVDSKRINYNDLLNIPYFSWREPVQILSNLPTTGNTTGDARIVLDSNGIFVWNIDQWVQISSGNFVHNHDERYYTEDEVDDLLSSLQLWVTQQLATKSDIGHIHDDRYYTETEIDARFNTVSGHDHDGLNSRQISYNNLADKPNFDPNHIHDDRYYTKTDLQTPNQAIVDWENIVNAPPIGAAGQWKSPVQSVDDLPTTGNTTGDTRLVLDTSDVYEWNGTEWVYIGHWNFVEQHWKEPVQEYVDLPGTGTGNVDGDVRLVMSENNIYRWDESIQMWVIVASSTSLNCQVYLNGIQLMEHEEWSRTRETGVHIHEDINAGDRVTLIFTEQYFLREDFIALEDQTEFVINIYYSKDQHVIQTEGQTIINTSQEYIMGSNDLLVWLNGVLQERDIDYIEQFPDQFYFLDPLHVGDRVIVIIMGKGSGTFIREDQNPTSVDQVRYTLVNTYAPGTGTLLVYLNGQLLSIGKDYNEDINNSIVLVLPADLDDDLTFLIFEVGEVGTQPGECCNAENVTIGTPADGTWNDGLLQYWNDQYHVTEALDDINEALKILAPPAPLTFGNRDLVPEEGLEYYAGYVSGGSTNYEIGPGEYHTYLTERSSFRYYTPNDSFIDANQGSIKMFLNGVEVDAFNLYNAFVVANETTSQSGLSYGVKSQGARENEGYIGTDGAIRNSVNGYLSIMSVAADNGLKYYQVGRVRININTGRLRPGYNMFYIVHELTSGVRISNVVKLFFDDANSRPELGETITLENLNLNSNKYLSGVRYYSMSDEFRLTTYSIAAYGNTYTDIPLTADMPGVEQMDFEYDHPDLVDYNSPPDKSDLFELRHDFTLNEANQYSIDARMRINTFDPFGAGQSVLTPTVNRLVHTYSNGSNDLQEYFRDEKYRLRPFMNVDVLPINRIGNWNSSLPLTVDDALLFDLKLQYANQTFTQYRPTQTINYSGRTLPQTYIRSFFHNKPHNNGILHINGLDKQTILDYTKVKVEIKLPTQTGWLDLSKDYDIRTFNGVDGDGCLLRVENTNDFMFTTDILSTAYSGYMIIVKITLFSLDSPKISYMELKY